MDQQDFNFDNDQPCSQKIHLEHTQLESLIELMSNIIIHVYNSGENRTNEYHQEDHQD